MSKLTTAIALASALTFIPAIASAEVSVADNLDYDSVLSINVPQSLDLGNVVAENACRDCYNNPGRPAPVPRPAAGRPAPRPSHVPPPPPPRRQVEVRHYRTTTVVRPQPVVVVEQPSTVVVQEESVSSSSSHEGAILGFGVRGVGALQSSLKLENGDCLDTTMNGGVGYYIKFRPVRYLSIEFINDIMFGGYKDGVDGSYTRVPVSLGLRGHVLDYGWLDLYGVAAASVTFVSLSDGYDSMYHDPNYDDTHFALFGGQFGVGVSFIASGFEIGVDARYTLEQTPEKTVMGYADQSELVHGLIFSVNLGFAI